MTVQLFIGTDKCDYIPLTVGEVVWEIDRSGSPSMLTFTVAKEGKLSFGEGAEVHLWKDFTPIFKGYIFEKSRDKNHHIQCVAYDQLRYFKAKDNFVHEEALTATEIIRRLANDYEVKVGDLADTMLPLEPHAYVDKTVFDIITSAIDNTVGRTHRYYILYDDCGKLTLKSADNMKVDYVVYNSTIQNFDYKSSIDEDTYTRVRVYHEIDEKNASGKKPRDARQIDHAENMERWGTLLLYEKAPEFITDLSAYARELLKRKSRVTRNLTVKGCIGDSRVRGGSRVLVDLDLGDVKPFVWLSVLNVTHRFTNDYHFMDLTLTDDDGKLGLVG